MTIKAYVIDRKAGKYKKIVLQKARLAASFLSLNGYLEIFLVGDKQMEKNVLSYVGKETQTDFPRPDLKEKYLGEVYLNPFYIEANNENLVFMLFHGLLHIAGYDHKKKNDRIKMEKKEAELLKKFEARKSKLETNLK